MKKVKSGKKMNGKRGQKGPHKKRGGKPPLGLTREMPDGTEVFMTDEWAGLGLKPKQRALLEAYTACGSIRKAAQAAGVSRNNHGRWIKGDEKYVAAFEAAKEVACEVLEDEARRRAVDGVEEPIYYQGVRVGCRQVRSDILLMFLLKGANPEKYRERADVTHRGGGEPIAVDVNLAAELLKKVMEFATKPGVPGIGRKG